MDILFKQKMVGQDGLEKEETKATETAQTTLSRRMVPMERMILEEEVG